MTVSEIASKIIRFSFYLLFFLVPLVFYSGSHELFEYNKMMLTYGLTIIIVGAWTIKLIFSFQFSIFNENSKFQISNFRWGPLGIPLIIYLATHVVSTIFSIDPHVSIWGYYSRFHEGLLATVSYVLLYFAAVNNLRREDVIKILKLSLFSAVIVSVWGTMEHFGVSPSCGIITGKWDVDCWVQDVRNRVFATLGQPNWMAAYLDVVLLATLGFSIEEQFFKRTVLFKNRLWTYLLLPVLFFAALLFTKSRSGILGLALGSSILAGALIYAHRANLKILLFNRSLILSSLLFLISSIVFGLPFSQTEKYSLENFLTKGSSTVNSKLKSTVNSGYIDIGISESGDIRKIVWSGAVKVWQRYPIFGSGVETFAYAYYKDRPVAHNMVSEWDFLYNKAHNEYLNLLATTGTVGFVAYASIIIVFILWVIFNFQLKIFNQFSIIKNSKVQNSIQIENFKFQISGLFAAWVSVLVTNFFGFSVVIVGLFFFLIPAFCFVLARPEAETSDAQNKPAKLGIAKIGLMSLVGLMSLMGLMGLMRLFNMWRADKAFAFGKNLDGVSQYVTAYPYLTSAVQLNPGEPTFRDELAFNQAVLALAIYSQINTATESGIATLSAQTKREIKHPQFGLSTNEFMAEAVANSNKVVETSPNALPFWKTRTRVFYQLATIEPKYYADALAAIKVAAILAPTDAKVHYNLGLLWGQNGQRAEAIKTFEETIAMKSDYRDAYFALGLYYKEAGNMEKARAQMEYILSRIGPDEGAKKFLEENK